MVDVVGLRFITEGEQNALNALDRYRRGLTDMSRLQDKHVAAMNRAVQEEMRGFRALQIAKDRYFKDEMQRVAQQIQLMERSTAAQAKQIAQEVRDFEAAKTLKLRSMQAAYEAEIALAQRAAQEQARINQVLGISGGVNRPASESAAVFMTQLREQEAAQAQAAAATQTFLAGLLQIDQPYRSAADSASAFTAALRQQEEDTARAARATQTYLAGLLQIDQPYRSAAASADVFVMQLREQEAATARAARATQEHLAVLLRINQPYKSAEQSADAFVQAQVQAESAYDRLRASIDPTVAAQLRMAEAERVVSNAVRQGVIGKEQAQQTLQALGAALNNTAKANEMLRMETQALAMRYNPAMAAATAYEGAVERLNRAHTLGVLTTDRLRMEIAQLDAQYKAIGTSSTQAMNFVNQFGNVTQVAGVKTNKFGMYAQQVGYQVGDFFVQLQSGTNAFVAFGQQATQLAGLLPGLLGAVLGIGISVSTMFLAMWSRTREATDNAASSAKRYTEALESLRQQSASTRDELTALFAGFQGSEEGALLNEIARREREMQDLPSLFRAQQEAIRQENAATSGVDLPFSAREIAAQNAAIERQLSTLRERNRVDREQLETLRQQREELRRANEVADAISSRQEENDLLVRQLDLMRQGVEVAEARRRAEEQILMEHARIVSEAENATDAQREFANRLLESINHANALRGAVDSVAGAAANAASAASRIAGALASAVSAVNNIQRRADDLRFQNDLLSGGASEAEARAQTAARAFRRDQESALRQAGGTAFITRAQIERLDAMARQVYESELALQREQERGRTFTSTGGGSGGGGGVASSIADTILQMEEQARRQEHLISLDERRRREMEIFYQLKDANQRADIQMTDERLARYAQELAASQERIEAMRAEQELAKTLGGALGGLFTAATRGSDAFRQSLSGLLNQLAQVLANRAFTSLLSGGGRSGGLLGGLSSLTNWLFNANGNAFMGGTVVPFARGGVVDQPMTFPMSGNRTGLMGEAGPEAIMPLRRGRDGRLGVEMHGGSQRVQVDVMMHVPEHVTLEEVTAISGNVAVNIMQRGLAQNRQALPRQLDQVNARGR